ncbi:intermembrane transport protein PqiB [Bordetella bronchialis]|uniref:Paraquat-inducible protein B n=1 Tax=Bordetella bronchialis TaxID=463025 RepID=A0A193G0I9_9BORD|nr:MlaD family protein [Bordetella bronchialis]ANN67657.1 paraquat-inducible protein B [Bordetella bronchialis]ANN72749.1 paraquat-inducible protein B [Bordetella bronchialis]
MSDAAPSGDHQRIRTPEVIRRKRRISWIWLVPFVAAVAGLSLVARTWFESGPTITITFKTAEGLEVGKTQVRYKDVNIGTVRSIRLSEDRSNVIVKAELVKDAASIAREGTQFWVVRPRLGLSGVSGLTTLLSGAYIGVDANNGKDASGKPLSDEEKTEFVGLETPPEVTHDRPGKRFTVRATDLGSLDVGSPVYYRRISVGQVIGYQLDSTGHFVNIQIFVDAPNDKFVTTDTHFWNASGVDFTLNADGLKVRTQSLLSVAVGGIAFGQRDDDATDTPAKADTVFTLYGTQAAAEATEDGEPFPIVMHFDQSIRGLSVGAPVDFNGVVLGQVGSISMDFDKESKRFFAVVRADLFPQRLGPVYERVRQFSEQEDREVDGTKVIHPGGRLLGAMVQHGLRAQLRSSNLLTGQLYVALDVFPNAKPAKFEMSTPAQIPTQPGNLDQLQQQIANVANKLDKIPFDKIGTDLQRTLENTARLTARVDKQLAPQAEALLKQANKSLADLGNLLAPDSALPVNAQRAMDELSRAARSLRALADYLQTNPEALLRGRGPDPLPNYGATRSGR